MSTERRWLKVADIQRELGFAKPDPVLQLIHAGLLQATNVSAGSGRPTWRIAQADFDAFMASRRAKPAPKPERRRGRGQQTVTQYF